jgi:LuxR family maltose regulon positive regulatory protein
VRRADGEERAAESLVRALELAGRELVLPFIGALTDLGELILRHPLLAAHWPLPTRGALIDATDAAEASTKPRATDPLTDREQAVLRCLATSMSTRDIATDLGLSVNTVKTHIASIYRKLNRSRRRDAVLRARSLELL